MKRWGIFFATVCGAVLPSESAVLYVDVRSKNPVVPYADWSTAAVSIQDAVDAAIAADEIVVTNGAYATGGRAVYGAETNRVAVDKMVAIRSVNGPEFTIIRGFQVPAVTNGQGAIRCMYLTNGASVVGFTLTGGGTSGEGGAVSCEGEWASLSNCIILGNAACQFGGAVARGTLNNCTIMSNLAAGGGGAASAILSNCVVSGNRAVAGSGGATASRLFNCTLSGNCAHDGGGAGGSTLLNCTLIGNTAVEYGGGAYMSELTNCTIRANSGWFGGGTADSTVLNSIVTGNSSFSAGGTYFGTARNCTITGNYAVDGGGIWGGTVENSIVYFNEAPQNANYEPGAPGYINYCCITPLPSSGLGNFSTDPQLASPSHLSAFSPCRGAGGRPFPMAVGSDIDGEEWATPPSVGCDEFWNGNAAGPLGVEIVAAFTNVVVDYPLELTARIEGRTTRSEWDFGGGVVLGNQPFTRRTWTAPGDYLVLLRVFNESNPQGVTATRTIHVIASPVHYVVANNPDAAPPYTTWASAATNIQDAVDAASTAGAKVLVSNGVYATGGRAMFSTMTNRLVIDKPLSVLSVNGSKFTRIKGWQVPGATNGDAAVRCVYLARRAMLSGFSLIDGATRATGDTVREQSGGGLWCESPEAIVSNCVMSGNCAALFGGGAGWCTLRNCLLMGNSAGQAGGAAAGSNLENCTVLGNAAAYEGGGTYVCDATNCTIVSNSAGNYGGGALYGTVNNSILYYNTAPQGMNYGVNDDLDYCCTTPQPTNGVGNFSYAPLFTDLASGDMQLRSDSPCINAGLNEYVSLGMRIDLDGNPRVSGDTVDVGAYEFQNPASRISYAWLQQYGLTNYAAADEEDPDGDGLNNWKEWRCGTNPTNSASVLRILTIGRIGLDLEVTWQSVTNRAYFLERGNSLGAEARFSRVATNIAGQFGVTTYLDTDIVGMGPFYYRIGVEE